MGKGKKIRSRKRDRFRSPISDGVAKKERKESKEG